MKKLKAVGLVLAAVLCGAVYGDSDWTLVSQTDVARGSRPVQTTAIVSKNLAVWHFGGPGLVEIGQLRPVDAGSGRLSLVGGCLSFNEDFTNLSIEGLGIHSRRVGDWQLHATGGFYSPRSDGILGWIGFSPETRLTRSIGGGVEVGIAADLWWFEGSQADLRIGPIIRQEGKEGSFALRYFPENKTVRLDIGTPIKTCW